ncbi:MAG: 1-phosphofructokinase [Eubacteriales bacterium]|nr:1-phosphofructokinase [Eubacteriales bacterium]
MIYTVTFNPSLDYSIQVDQFQTGQLNRTTAESIQVGGKGINVSVVLTRMGVPNIALGFIAGFTGEYIQNGMNELGCNTDFIHLPSGFSRINVKMTSGIETEINGKGPIIQEEEFKQLMIRIAKLKAGDTLVLAGSIPTSLPQDIYEQILEKVDTTKIRVVVDATSFLLRRTLAYRPYLIKPNLQELSELFARPLCEFDDIVCCARHLQEEGARNVLVSMGAQGALLVTEEDHVLAAPAPAGDVVDTIGAGDSMVAGFIAGYMERNSYVDAFRKGIAAGSATAFTSGLATAAQINDVGRRV